MISSVTVLPDVHIGYVRLALDYRLSVNLTRAGARGVAQPLSGNPSRVRPRRPKASQRRSARTWPHRCGGENFGCRRHLASREPIPISQTSSQRRPSAVAEVLLQLAGENSPPVGSGGGGRRRRAPVLHRRRADVAGRKRALTFLQVRPAFLGPICRVLYSSLVAQQDSRHLTYLSHKIGGWFAPGVPTPTSRHSKTSSTTLPSKSSRSQCPDAGCRFPTGASSSPSTTRRFAARRARTPA